MYICTYSQSVFAWYTHTKPISSATLPHCFCSHTTVQSNKFMCCEEPNTMAFLAKQQSHMIRNLLHRLRLICNQANASIKLCRRCEINKKKLKTILFDLQPFNNTL